MSLDQTRREPDQETTAPLTETKIAVRTLVEFVHRSGGLDSITYHQLSANKGTRTHQAFFAHLKASYPHHRFMSEFTLKGAYERQGLRLHIGGRADLFILPDSDMPSFEDSTEDAQASIPANARKTSSERALFTTHETSKPFSDLTTSTLPFFCEVKTVGRPLSDINPEGETLHWTQVMMYTALYYFYHPALLEALAQSEPLPDLLNPESNRVLTPNEDIRPYAEIEVPYILTYISQETLECLILERTITLQDLWNWYRETIEKYLKWASLQAHHLKLRDQSIHSLPFPYAKPREGQTRLMEAVARSLKTRTPLLAQAPTGSGKTMATLYPALQSLADHQVDRIFYLTAKVATREVAEQALKDLEQVGLHARAITLMAKEQMCLAPELYCDTALCPYAVHYYDRLDQGLERTLEASLIQQDFLKAVGKELGLCPFELSLDTASYCDVIIGDYNYALDPRVKLDRFFGESEETSALLFDEAHNLADRSRDMFSANLDLATFISLKDMLPDTAWFYQQMLQTVITHLEEMRDGIQNKDGAKAYLAEVQGVDLNKTQILEAPGFVGLTSQAPALVKLLRTFLKDFRDILDLDFPPNIRRKIIELIGMVRFFLRICDEFWNESYILAMRYKGDKLALRLICLDASNFIANLYYPKHAGIFFSATLVPFAYYRQVICGDVVRPVELDLPSPFDPSHLQTLILNTISTRYRDRRLSKVPIARAIIIAQRVKRGQMICYFPSYAYMNLVLPEVLSLLPKSVEVVVQKPGMSPRERENWIAAFRSPKAKKEVLGFAVLGGMFAEGIDLVGKQLTGIIIIGTGLPGISPERNIMQQYYDQKQQSGYHTAYTWPGFNKVQQAAGRLIRTATDRGFVLLLDDRYQQKDYLQLLPEHWFPLFLDSERELLEALKEGKRGTKSYGGFRGQGSGDDQVQAFGADGGVQASPW